MTSREERIKEIEEMAERRTDKFHSDWEWDMINAKKGVAKQALSIIKELQKEIKKLKEESDAESLLKELIIKCFYHYEEDFLDWAHDNASFILSCDELSLSKSLYKFYKKHNLEQIK